VIVGYQPGGSIKDARVVLKFGEKLPNRYNVSETIVYREAEDDPRQWILVKPRGQVLLSDSPLLSQPTLPEVENFEVKNFLEENPDTLYEHQDIIRLESQEEK
jgi:hypothetical protein